MSAIDVGGAIAERPRRVERFPLLEAIYSRHDALIDRFASGQTLEIAAGEYAHPATDVALDIFPANCRAHETGVVGDARQLPFSDGSFETVIGRRFVHHVPEDQRSAIVKEIDRILSDGGRFILLEGTPGRYRRLVKKAGFTLGVLGEDTDEYSHCNPTELRDHLTTTGFRIRVDRQLGSPLMPAAILQHQQTERLLPAIERTQWVTWWTFLVGETEG